MTLLGRDQCEIIDGIAVRGDDEFRWRTRESITLLQRTTGIEIVRAHLKIIRQGRRSGVRAWAKKPAFVAGRATWQHSPLWYAGAIAHDAYHIKLYAAAKKTAGGVEPAASAWTGMAAEKQCLAFQYEVLQALDSDKHTLNYIARCRENPVYQGRDSGPGSRLDYLRRWW